MPELSDIQNELIRDEIEQYIEREDERRHIIQLYAKARPSLQDMAAGIIEGDHHGVDKLTKAALDDGIEALEVMDDGLIAGMAIVGIKFRENFIFVPEVLACARAMKAGMAHIEPILSASGIQPIGRVIMGTVKGDLAGGYFRRVGGSEDKRFDTSPRGISRQCRARVSRCRDGDASYTQRPGHADSNSHAATFERTGRQATFILDQDLRAFEPSLQRRQRD